MRAVPMILCLLSALPAMPATPAGAQIWDGGRSAVRDVPAPPTALIDGDLGAIDRSIRDGRRRGDLSRAEARLLRAESGAIERMARDYRRGGPIAMNADALARRTLALRGRVDAARARGR